MRLAEFNWPGGSFLISYHIILLITLPIYLVNNAFPTALFLWTLLLAALCELSVTSGYHRLYTHKTYKLNKIAEFILIAIGTLATQGSIIKWAHDHRLHHQYVDTDKDPYSVKKGFWHAHFFWMMKKSKFNKHLVSDLFKNKLVKIQHDYYTLWLIIVNLLIIFIFGWYYQNYFGAFVFIFLLRTFIIHHITWSVNSASHTFGSQPYSTASTATDSTLSALFTFGEEYHNFHHTFPDDYRNGYKTWQYDPTKWTIWLLNKTGLAHALQRTREEAVQNAIEFTKKKI
ncbi:acyl-CoA desaturase [Candidatus Woesearchaeota archaeon CG10_big_fil_rev_8_21_14_0_10_37_12]|nr:MAG: acyl-CoA desaturase [Candidatus Woesearchaeota archaeon CG10_big_fil_rev_8_21_14_0_10_37_12]